MTETGILGLKQQLVKLPEEQRHEISAFLIRLGQEDEEWKQETARRLDRMAAGEQTSVEELRNQLGHAE